MSYATGPEKSPLAAAGCKQNIIIKPEEMRPVATLSSQLPGLGLRSEQLHLWQSSYIFLPCS